MQLKMRRQLEPLVLKYQERECKDLFQIRQIMV